jgi:hypothetical protein
VKLHIRIICLGTILMVYGCTGRDTSPAAPEPVLPPYWTGDENYICGAWYGQRPESTYVLLDAAVSSPVPISEQIEILEAHGAYIRHVFNVSLIRTIIPVDTLEFLYPQVVAFARGVPDPDSYLVQHLVVLYDRAIQKGDSVALQLLGVTILRESYGHTFFTVSAEDGVIPQIRRLPGVTDVYLDSYACPLVEGAR